jgi:serine/threonine-protein kinase HipA
LKLRPDEPLHVALAYAPDDIMPVGRLALERGRAVFGYDASFIASGRRFHPAWGAPDRSIIRAKAPRTFSGLHGAFADSLPDAWGFEIMRRRAAHQGVDYAALSALDRLALVGQTGLGALVYRPDHSFTDGADVDLDALADGALAVLEGTATEVVEELARLGGSSGGARPKVFVARNGAGKAIAGTTRIPAGFTAYIVKFKGRTDVSDIGPLEAAYADMARAAGIEVSPTTLIEASSGAGYFATERFDRAGQNRRVHMLSVAGTFELDWSEPAIDYATLITMVARVTRNAVFAERMFRRMAFNVFAVNRDDHTKQHSFLQIRAGDWVLAPAYDLTLSTGPNGEHYLAVNGKGNGITVDDVLAVAREVSIRPARAKEIVEEVRGAVANFPAFAKKYGVTNATMSAFRQHQAA